MDFQKMIDSLERFGRMLPEVVRNVNSKDAGWKPPDGAWSILEVVCHLADEEEFDFRERIKRTLTDPEQTWPHIDPEGWAISRQYNEGKLDDAVSRFVSLRNQSLSWVRSLDQADWAAAYLHPKFGPIHAGDILCAWVAHDYLHLRQIAKRMYQMVTRDGEGFSTRYAGEWGA